MESRQRPHKAASSRKKQRAGRFQWAQSFASRSRLALPLLFACLLLGLLAGKAQAGGKGIFVWSEPFLKVQNPDRNIPPLGKEGAPPKDIDPRHLTVGPFGPTDGRGTGGLYIQPETMREERIPGLFGKIPVSEPSLEDMHGVEGWCYTAATPSDRTAVLMLYGVYGLVREGQGHRLRVGGVQPGGTVAKPHGREQQDKRVGASCHSDVAALDNLLDFICFEFPA